MGPFIIPSLAIGFLLPSIVISSRISLFSCNGPECAGVARSGRPVKGEFDVSSNQCLQLPYQWKSVAIGLSTHGSCFRVFRSSDCSGGYLEVAPGRGCHHNLGNCGPWGRAVQSISNCGFTKSVPTTRRTTPVPIRRTTVTDERKCPSGKYVKRVKMIEGLSSHSIELSCYAPEDVQATVVNVGAHMVPRRGMLTSCDGPMRGIAVITTDKKLVAEGFCTYDVKKEPFNSLCDDPMQAVCGLKIVSTKSIQGSSQVDATYTGHPICCRVILPQCTASDRWEVIHEYDNTAGTTGKQIMFQKSVGVGTSKSMSQAQSRSNDFFTNFANTQSTSSGKSSGSQTNVGGNAGFSMFGFSLGGQASYGTNSGTHSEVAKGFQKSIGESKNTGVNWGQQNDATWNSQKMTMVQMEVPSGVRVRIEQPVGTCGSIEVRSDVTRRKDFDRNGNPFVSGVTFQKRKRGCGIVDHRPGSVIRLEEPLNPLLPGGTEIWDADTYNVTKVTESKHAHTPYLTTFFKASSSMLWLQTSDSFPKFYEEQGTTTIIRVLNLQCKDGTSVQYRFEFALGFSGPGGAQQEEEAEEEQERVRA